MENQRFKDFKRLSMFLLSISIAMLTSTLFIKNDENDDVLFISVFAIILMIVGFISLFKMFKVKK